MPSDAKRSDRERKRQGKIVGPTFGGRNGGPLGMKGGRRNLKEYAK
jgi:hypothetical protein